MSGSPPVLLAINDLIFESRIRATARACGLEVRSVRSAAELASALAEARVSLVIIDLNTVESPIDAVRAATAAQTVPSVIAFVSHVDAELAHGAQEAGAGRVLPRSKFVNELPAIMESAGGLGSGQLDQNS